MPTEARKPRRDFSALDARSRLIHVGVEILSEKGYHNTGLDELVKRSGIPKGSFYYYFGSKTEYGFAVIDQYAYIWEQRLIRLLSDPSVKPLQRIRNYIAEGVAGLEQHAFRRGCLIGNMGQELGALDDAFRQKILRVFESWTKHLANCLQEAIDAGDLKTSGGAQELASFFWMAWEGAIVQAKLEQSTRPVERLQNVMFGHIFCSTAAAPAAVASVGSRR
jgi:TetR/AcrR family transcriptional repressor of nem operon